MNTEQKHYDIKEIVGNGNMANFSHAIAGVLYYEVTTTADSKYMFPIDMNDKEDVGTATFDANIKAITLMRYIRKSIENKSLIQLK